MSQGREYHSVSRKLVGLSNVCTGKDLVDRCHFRASESKHHPSRENPCGKVVLYQNRQNTALAPGIPRCARNDIMSKVPPSRRSSRRDRCSSYRPLRGFRNARIETDPGISVVSIRVMERLQTNRSPSPYGRSLPASTNRKSYSHLLLPLAV